MQDTYAGQAGTFIVDPDKGVRIPIEQYQAEQAMKVQTEKAKTRARSTDNTEQETT
jgi:hypothetical protein